MSNPPFQPLTLSVEQIAELRAELPKARQSYDEPNPEKRDWLPIFRVLMDCEFLIRSHEALRQEAASLRDCEKLRTGADQDEEMTHQECESLKAQLEQAQKERSQAEAALAELQKQFRQADNCLVQQNAMMEAIEQALDGNEPSDFMLSFGIVQRIWDIVAELQRRRSPRAEPQEK